jgi:hypothetical protein
MVWLRWIVILLALQQAGWMALDGARSLIVGDYFTPRHGPHAGQLGAWSKLVSRVGINPRSTHMKSFFAAYGAAWLIVIVCFVLGLPWARRAMLVAAVGSLWFFPFGTLSSGIQIVLLAFLTRIPAGGGS